MWAHYANSFKGYCLEFSYEVLYKHFTSMNGHVGASPVNYNENELITPVHQDEFFKQYADKFVNSETGSIMKPFTTKSSHWIKEQEYRFFHEKEGKVDIPSKSLSSIYIGNKTPCWLITNLKTICNEHYPNAKIYQVEISKNEYKLEFKNIN
jgi:hypothetical protein